MSKAYQSGVAVRRPPMLAALRSMTTLNALLGEGNYHMIAAKSGYARQHVSRVLHGATGVSLAALSRMADAAEVTLDEMRYYIARQQERRRREGL